MLSFLSVAAFLAVTSGFTVYTHYCTDTTLKKQSIVASQATCEHDHNVSKSHYMHDLLSSCSTNCNLISDECCTDEKQFFKLSDVFILPTVTVEEKCFSTYTITTTLDHLKLELESSINEPISIYSLPPPISGKQKVLLYRQLETDPDPAV